MAKICIVQRRLTHYRAKFFGALREELAERGVYLDLLVGRGTPSEEQKRDTGMLPWAKTVETRYWAGGRLCWQSLGPHLEGLDLLVVTQENKLLQNHLLMLAPRRFRMAFWGHGANLQSNNPLSIKERFKRWTTTRVDWWFAYTNVSVELVKAAGFPANRITVLNNTVDTKELHCFWKQVKPSETQALRESLGFGMGRVGIYVGSLYSDKRLDFLFAAADEIRRRVPNFHLVIVGEGPDREKVRHWCNSRIWARWVGTRFGQEKAAYMSVADVMLSPGAVGLGVMDAFACEVPMIATNCGNHGPEIDYIDNGVNGVITKDDLGPYVDAAIRLLQDGNALDALRKGCAFSAQEYTLENMVRRFADGVANCLGMTR